MGLFVATCRLMYRPLAVYYGGIPVYMTWCCISRPFFFPFQGPSYKFHSLGCWLSGKLCKWSTCQFFPHRRLAPRGIIIMLRFSRPVPRSRSAIITRPQQRQRHAESTTRLVEPKMSKLDVSSASEGCSRERPGAPLGLGTLVVTSDDFDWTRMGSATARTTWLKNVSWPSYVACARCSWDVLRRVSHGVSFGPTLIDPCYPPHRPATALTLAAL